MKIGAIIQARHDSTRFQGKVLKNLPFDSHETVLSQIYKRLKMVKSLDEIIIATSDETTDDIIEQYCEQNNFLCIRGSKTNVLKRFTKVIKERNLDTVVRITGDNPVVFVDLMDDVIQKHKKSNADYSRNLNLPYGTGFEVINAEVLHDIYENKSTTTSDQEHVTVYIKNNSEKYKILEIKHNLEPIGFRFTVDYPSDYAAMNIVFQYLAHNNYIYEYEMLRNFMNHNKWIADINKMNFQKKQYQSLQEEIQEASRILQNLDMNNVADLLKNF